ncbi:MAG TPA: ribonucleotide-diphosphate reductase subunit beta, partial [Agriterribacter sp.]|nr:ribonucleotide-diphosphate reductase subunit beta [Agriterribacter sp.]
MGLFDKRVQYKPFEYPEVLRFSSAINKSFWVHSEVDFTADVQDFHAHLSVPEQEAVKNSLLAIAQIEVAVKSFWGNLYHHF